MERSGAKPSLKKPRSSFLSWIFNHSDTSKDPMYLSQSTPTTTTPCTVPKVAVSASDIEIPNRRQSHLYTPFHQVFEKEEEEDMYKEKPYLTTIDNHTHYGSSASLTRSATWQPSSHHTQQTATTVELIPDRRTSRNYANNPEIQARLDAMLQNDKTCYLSSVLQQQPTSSAMNRRSTAPSSRTS